MMSNSPTSCSLFRGAVAFGLALAYLIDAAPGSSYTPVSFGVGTAPIIDGLQKYSGNTKVTLNSSAPVLTLDYGAEVAGFPYFEVTSLSGPAAQIELKYSEPFDGLNQQKGDGPWLYTNGLMISFRTETFNITATGKTESFFIQGGQRWQSIIPVHPKV